jgi:exodeoxyribonuclease III
MAAETLTISTLNIGAASLDRARRLVAEWLTTPSHDVHVLTEVSDGPGTAYVATQFSMAGWQVFKPKLREGGRGVLVASRVRAVESLRYPPNEPSPGRCVLVELRSTPTIEIVGMYVPNRGKEPSKLDRKREFMEQWLDHLTSDSAASHRVLIGDLNVVPPTQRPVFLPQLPFEDAWYNGLVADLRLEDVAQRCNGGEHESTWVSHSGEGYTYDHVLSALSLRDRVISCRYDHSPRDRGGVTDHSALILTLGVDAVQRIHHQPLVVQTQTALF